MMHHNDRILSEELKQFPGILVTDGYFKLPKAFYGLVRGGLPIGSVILASVYIYIDGFEGSGVINCCDDRAEKILGKKVRTIQRWRRPLQHYKLIKGKRGSKYIDISELKRELALTAELERTTDLTDLGGIYIWPLVSEVTDLSRNDTSDRSDDKCQKRHTGSDKSDLTGTSKTSDSIQTAVTVKSTNLLNDGDSAQSVQGPASPPSEFEIHIQSLTREILTKNYLDRPDDLVQRCQHEHPFVRKEAIKRARIAEKSNEKKIKTEEVL